MLGTIEGAGAGLVWTRRSGPSAAVQLGSLHEYSETATAGRVGVPVMLPSGSYMTVGFGLIWYARSRMVTSLRSRGAASVHRSIRQ